MRESSIHNRNCLGHPYQFALTASINHISCFFTFQQYIPDNACAL